MNTEDLIELHIQSLDAYNKGRRALSKEEVGEALFHFLRALDLFPEAMLVEPQLDRQTRLSMQQLKANILSHIELVKEDFPGVSAKAPAGWRGDQPGARQTAGVPPQSAPEPEPPVLHEEDMGLEETSSHDDLSALEGLVEEAPPSGQEDLANEAALDALLEEEPLVSVEPPAIPPQVSPFEEDVQLVEEEPAGSLEGMETSALDAALAPEPAVELELESALMAEPAPEADEAVPQPAVEEDLLVDLEAPGLPPGGMPDQEPVLDDLLEAVAPVPEEPPAIDLDLDMETPDLPVEEEPSSVLDDLIAEPEVPAELKEPEPPLAPPPSPSLDEANLLSDLEPPAIGEPPVSTAPAAAPPPEQAVQSAPVDEIPLPPVPEPPPVLKKKRIKRKRVSRRRETQLALLAVLLISLVTVLYSNSADLTFNKTFMAFEEASDFSKKLSLLKTLYQKAAFMENKNFMLKTFAPGKHKLGVEQTFLKLDAAALLAAQQNSTHASEFIEQIDGRYWDKEKTEGYLKFLKTEHETKGHLPEGHEKLGARLIQFHCKAIGGLCETMKPLLPAITMPAVQEKDHKEKAHPPAAKPVEKSGGDHVEKLKPEEKKEKKPLSPAPGEAFKEHPSKLAGIRSYLTRLGFKPRQISFSPQGETLYFSYESDLASPKVQAALPVNEQKSKRNAEFVKVMDAIVAALGDDAYEVNILEYRMFPPGGTKLYKGYRVTFQRYLRWTKTGKVEELGERAIQPLK